jgi:hypothetical protein
MAHSIAGRHPGQGAQRREPGPIPAKNVISHLLYTRPFRHGSRILLRNSGMTTGGGFPRALHEGVRA